MLGQGTHKIAVKSKLPAALRALKGREVVVVGREFGREVVSDILAYNPECVVILLRDDAPDRVCKAYECIESGKYGPQAAGLGPEAMRVGAMRSELRELMGEHKLPHFLESRHKTMQRALRMIEEAAPSTSRC